MSEKKLKKKIVEDRSLPLTIDSLKNSSSLRTSMHGDWKPCT